MMRLFSFIHRYPGVLISIVLLFFCAACLSSGQETPMSGSGLTVDTAVPEQSSLVQPTTNYIPSLTIDSLKTAEYYTSLVMPTVEEIPGLTPEGKVKLQNGFYQASPVGDDVITTGYSIMLLEPYTFGDIDGDGVEDAAVLLAENIGGSGVFISLAAVLNQGGEPLNVSNLMLGDRVQVETISFQEGTIFLKMLVHGAEDPMCCPSLEITSRYQFIEGRLVDMLEVEVWPQAEAAIQALKAKDMTALAGLVSPQIGLKFSPYAYVRDEDAVFSSSELVGVFENPSKYVWGLYDGSGMPIELTFAEYYDRFIYSRDFATAERISFNERIGWGNSMDNSQEYYQGAVVVEFYFSGFDEQYAGMDWRSLRLVFQKSDGQWMLVGIINDEWTT